MGKVHCVAVKNNQKTLADDICLFFEKPPDVYVLDENIQADKNHGRLETRRCRIFTEVTWLEQRQAWSGLACLICVESWVEKVGKSTYSLCHYIGSLAMTTQTAQYAVRSHWTIENKLHWVLGVLMREDLARNRTNDGAHNLAILRHMGTNLLRNDKINKHSLKVCRKQAEGQPSI